MWSVSSVCACVCDSFFVLVYAKKKKKSPYLDHLPCAPGKCVYLYASTAFTLVPPSLRVPVVDELTLHSPPFDCVRVCFCEPVMSWQEIGC